MSKNHALDTSQLTPREFRQQLEELAEQRRRKRALDEAQMTYLRRYRPMMMVSSLCWTLGKWAGLVGLVARLVSGPGNLTSICLGFLLLGGVAQVAFYIAITPGFIRETNRVKQEMPD